MFARFRPKPTLVIKRILDQFQRRCPDAHQAVSQLDLFAGLLVIRGDGSRLTAPDRQLLLICSVTPIGRN
jgi:hypothetical protein